MNDDLLGYALVTALVIIPALGLTARLAIKPVVDAIVRLKETFASAPDPLVERRLLELEAELRATQREVQRLKEGQAFDRALAPQPVPSPTLSSGPSARGASVDGSPAEQV